MPSEDYKVYLGNVPDDARERDVEKFFKGYGHIFNIVLKVRFRKIGTTRIHDILFWPPRRGRLWSSGAAPYELLHGSSILSSWSRSPVEM